MSFTRRNVAIRTPAQRQPSEGSSDNAKASPEPSRPQRAPGTRPSPVDGRPTTSTGCLSLDGLLAGHAGLALGSSLLIGESGTTDYASTLLRYYAAEGVVQGHKVHVVGMPESWGRDLPAAIGAAHAGESGEHSSSKESERMKIAWRYERLGEVGAGNARARSITSKDVQDAPDSQSTLPFCHAFDLTKRLTLPSSSAINFIPVGPPADPFAYILRSITQFLQSTAGELTPHRLMIPSLLSPAVYPQAASQPSKLLPFLHAIRALLRNHSSRLTVFISLPLTLYPRSTGLTRWIELLSDGVLELLPFPHSFDNQVDAVGLGTSGAATSAEERPQGMLKVHRLPVVSERGGGGAGVSEGVEDDLAFTVSRRKFVIKPFSLPPVEGDTEAQEGRAEEKKMPKKADLEF